MKLKGFVKVLNTKEGRGKRGPWTLYSTILEDNGQESGWISLGFEKPPFEKGDYVQLEARESDRGGLEFIAGTGRVVKNPPAKPAATKADNKADSGSTGSGSIPVNRTQQSIHYQNSRTAAIAVVGLLADLDALPIAKTATAAGKAERYAEVKSIVDKLTVQYYNDLESFRLLDTVKDAGVTEAKIDGSLPAKDDAKEDADEEAGDEGYQD